MGINAKLAHMGQASYQLAIIMPKLLETLICTLEQRNTIEKKSKEKKIVIKNLFDINEIGLNKRKQEVFVYIINKPEDLRTLFGN